MAPIDLFDEKSLKLSSTLQEADQQTHTNTSSSTTTTSTTPNENKILVVKEEFSNSVQQATSKLTSSLLKIAEAKSNEMSIDENNVSNATVVNVDSRRDSTHTHHDHATSPTQTHTGDDEATSETASSSSASSSPSAVRTPDSTPLKTASTDKEYHHHHLNDDEVISSNSSSSFSSSSLSPPLSDLNCSLPKCVHASTADPTEVENESIKSNHHNDEIINDPNDEMRDRKSSNECTSTDSPTPTPTPNESNTQSVEKFTEFSNNKNEPKLA